MRNSCSNTNMRQEEFAVISAAFHESLIQHLNVYELRKMITVPVPTAGDMRVELRPYGLESVVLDEYADYLNTTNQNAVEKATILGAGCAILYNALIKNARFTKGHAVVTDLLDNENLKFAAVRNSEASVADPEGLIPGWISFRFRFASSNKSFTLEKGKTLLAVESARAL